MSAGKATPALSVVVPCYNAERTLARCLDSLLAQTADDLQVVCVNDGSSDGTLAIIQTYVEREPERIVCIDIPNGGSWNARMTGMHAATGTYVGFLDSDDYVEPTFAEHLLVKAQELDADMVVCGYSRVNEETGEVLAQEMCVEREAFCVADDPGLTIAVNSAMWNKIYRASVLAKMASLPAPPPVAEDFLFEVLFFLESTRPIAFVAEPLVNYLVHPNSLMTNIGQATIEPTYRAMRDARQILAERHATSEFIEAFDTSVFLHLGVSLNHALSGAPDVELGEAIKGCTAFLDATCPLWRRSRYLTARYAAAHGASYQRLRIAWLAYKMGLMVPFLKTYRFAITTLGINIKW